MESLSTCDDYPSNEGFLRNCLRNFSALTSQGNVADYSNLERSTVMKLAG